MLAAKITGKVDLGWTVVNIRALSGKSLRKAGEARQITAAQNAKSWGGELVQIFSKADTPEGKAEREKKAADPEARYNHYDRESVLIAGVTGWDSEEKLTNLDEQLTDEDAEKVHRAIIDLSLPTKAEAEAALKNA